MPSLPGQLSRAFDRLHSTIYFAAEASDRFSELGLENQRMQYFASRSAPMGAVTAKVVAATFYNFNPELVAKVIPAAWGIASPATATRCATRSSIRWSQQQWDDAVGAFRMPLPASVSMTPD